MTLARWKDLCLDASDAGRAAAFWSRVLGLAAERQESGDAVLRGDADTRTVWVNQVPEPKVAKNRVHLDLVQPSADPLLAAGARVLAEVDDGANWRVLADPEGNELCVFDCAQEEPSGLVVDSLDAVSLAGWWAQVLGAQVVPGPDGTPRWLTDVDGLPFDRWKFVPVAEPKTVKNRIHWDVVCEDVEELVVRGASLLREPDDVVNWHVLADPEGNEFCAFAP